MTDKLHDPRRQGPDARHPDHGLADLNPDAAAGQNFDRIGPHPEKDNPRTALDHKEAQRHLAGFDRDDLKQIPLLPAGSRLETNATYINLLDPARREFKASGSESVDTHDLIVPKREVPYELWNRLIGVTTPERTGQGGTKHG